MASSSSSSSSTHEYEVFLSFRGTDTRYTFISHLYHALYSKGVYTFKDDKELPPGQKIETLLEAVKQSKISIPVFSEEYGSSKWCMKEVAEMVQCKKMIMPIFFYVHPGDVKDQTGSFGIAFNKHNLPITHEWREALKEVGKISGWVHNKVENRDEAKLVEDIVKRVLKELNKTPVHVANHPIGLESRVKELLSLLSLGSKETRFVGICGMGGIGKTTMAKAVYNRIFETFDGDSSFLAEVKEKKLVDLQNQLLKNIIGVENLIDYVDEGKELIKQRLKRKTVLIILDDVDHHNQIEALAGDVSWFGPRSRIIITTRDKSVLKEGQVDNVEIYKLDELDKEQSLQLFSWHAFHQDQPPKEFMYLSGAVVSYARGLPLVLEVLGSSLHATKDVEIWKSKLLKLKKIPHKDVHLKLKISFDGLDEMEQAVFLDTACIFVGVKKERPVAMWKACGFCPEAVLDVLIQKFLLRIDENNFLWMHDQLKEMGRRIVNEKGEPGNRTRLWNGKEIIDVLKGHKGTQIEVIQLNSPRYEEEDNTTIEDSEEVDNIFNEDFEEEHDISNEDFEEEDTISLEAFATMSKLRILMINDREIMGNIDHLPSELKWLELDCPGLSDNTWNNGRQKKQFRNLKGVKLRSNQFVSPDFSRFPQLEHLILYSCDELVDVQSITQLKKLVCLELHGCYGLKKLHPGFCTLRFLKVLMLGSTGLEELPDSIGRLRKLERLSLTACKSLKRIPDSIGEMTSLVHLKLNSTRIRELPSVGGMKSLVEIYLNHTSIEWIPNDIGLLKELKKLYVMYCKSLERIPKLPSSLIIFNARGCKSLTVVEDQSSMCNLQELNLSFREDQTRWSSSGYLNYIGEMESLVKLFMGNSLIKELPEAIGLLNKLVTLCVKDCPNLESILKLPSSLIRLDASGCESLERLSDLSHMKNLKDLRLDFCMKLGEIQGLEGAESLEKLDVSGCNNLTNRMTNVLVQDSCNNRLFPFCESQQSLVISENEINDGKSLYLALKLVSAEEIRVTNGGLEIIADIYRNGRVITCSSVFPINEHDKIHGEKVCIQRFKGPNWFVLPLKVKDEIKIEDIRSCPKRFPGGMKLSANPPLEVKCYISFVDSSCIDDLRS